MVQLTQQDQPESKVKVGLILVYKPTGYSKMIAVFGICRLGNECSTLVGICELFCALFRVAEQRPPPHPLPSEFNRPLFSRRWTLIAPADALPRSQGAVGCVGRVRSDLGGAPRPGRSPAAPPAKRCQILASFRGPWGRFPHTKRAIYGGPYKTTKRHGLNPLGVAEMRRVGRLAVAAATSGSMLLFAATAAAAAAAAAKPKTKTKPKA